MKMYILYCVFFPTSQFILAFFCLSFLSFFLGVAAAVPVLGREMFSLLRPLSIFPGIYLNFPL